MAALAQETPFHATRAPRGIATPLSTKSAPLPLHVRRATMFIASAPTRVNDPPEAFLRSAARLRTLPLHRHVVSFNAWLEFSSGHLVQ